MIDYIAVAVLKPYKLYRLYTLISFVHEAGETPEIIKARLEGGINQARTASDASFWRAFQ